MKTYKKTIVLLCVAHAEVAASRTEKKDPAELAPLFVSTLPKRLIQLKEGLNVLYLRLQMTEIDALGHKKIVEEAPTKTCLRGAVQGLAHSLGPRHRWSDLRAQA